MIESDILLSNSMLTGGPTASELALNDCKCVQGFGCNWCRHVLNHKYALHVGIIGSHTCVLAGSCLQVLDNDVAEQEVGVRHRKRVGSAPLLAL